MREVLAELFDGPGISPDAGASRNVWPVPARSDGDAPRRSAAVLVPLVDRAAGMTVLLTQRTEHLEAHAGQISFPGGTLADGDATPEHTALRETEEEIGVAPATIELIGRLNTRDTSTGYRVVPVVGLLTPPFEITPDPGEVAAVFEVPLDFVRDPANHRIERRVIRGEEREFRAIPYGERYIWGLTARILHEFFELLRDR